MNDNGQKFLKNLTLLYVEDEEFTRKMFATFLQRLVGVLIVAKNGAEGVAAYREFTPDIVMTDINMPIMDGLTMVREIRTIDTGAQVPILFLTAHEEVSFLKSSITLGTTEYLVKPVNTGKLVEALRMCARQLHDEKMLREDKEQMVTFNEQLEKRVAEEVGKNREKDTMLLQQDKLASIGQLAAGVAHEINNPVGFIMSNLGTLKKYVENLDQYTSLLQGLVSTEGTFEAQHVVNEMSQKLNIEHIREDIENLIAESLEGTERIKQIVLDLKDFVRADEDRLKETDLNQCVRSTANIVRSEIKYVADLSLHLNRIPMIICNSQQINQVIANLLVNAAHAITGNGSITVTTLDENDRVTLSVTDTGCGIPPEIIDRIFDPFFTTKEVGHGTGLGLNISSTIVKKHGGTIRVESEIGTGTTFTVTLPVNCRR